MVKGSSPEWLPPGFTEKVKYKNGRKIKYYYNTTTGSKHYSKRDVLSCATTENDLCGAPQTTKEDGKGLSSNEKDDAVFNKPNDSPQWLPDGWIMEEKPRQRGAKKGDPYKVYIELSSGKKFYSRAAVGRYLNTTNHSTTVTSQNDVDDMDKPLLDTSQCISKAVTDRISKKKGGSFKMVATEITADEDLPSGWIKEIKTSKSGNRIRKDPFYIDPVSGYVFRSKRDALRYLETHDIGSCACRPLKRELDDPKLITNGIPSSNPADEKLPNHKRQLFTGEESNNGGETSGRKTLAELEGEILTKNQNSNLLDSVEVTSAGVDSIAENISNKNSSENTEMESNPAPANEVAKEDPRITNVDAGIGSPVADSLSTWKQLSENGIEKQADRTQRGSRKSKKRENSRIPIRTSKRLGGCEPEIPPGLDLSERSLRAAVRKSSGSEVDTSSIGKESASITLSPDVKSAKEAAEPVPISKETLEVIKPLDKIEKPQSEEVVNPDGSADGKTSEKLLDGSKRSQELRFPDDFGETWSDPLLFAFKTLNSDLSIEDTLKLTSGFNKQVDVLDNQVNGCLGSRQSDVPINIRNEFLPHSKRLTQLGASEQLNIPYNNQADGYLKSLQSDVPINFQNVFVPPPEPFNQYSTVHQLPGNAPLFPAPSNTVFPSCSGFNRQSTTEAGKKDYPKNFNH